jgi:hypothetical protein
MSKAKKALSGDQVAASKPGIGSAIASLVGIKLMSAKDIKALQDQAGTALVSGMKLLHDASVQTMLHVQKHHDTTLVDRLFTKVPPGVVVAGLRKWFEDNSPIRITSTKDAAGNFSHIAKELKADDPDFTPYEVQKANDKTFGQDRATVDRANNPIEPWSLELAQKRIAGLLRSFDKDMSGEGQRKMAKGENPTVIRAALLSAMEGVNKLAVLDEGNRKGAIAEASAIIDRQPGALSSKLTAANDGAKAPVKKKAG